MRDNGRMSQMTDSKPSQPNPFPAQAAPAKSGKLWAMIVAGCALAVAIVIVAVIALQFLEHRHFSQPPSVWPAPADAKR